MAILEQDFTKENPIAVLLPGEMFAKTDQTLTQTDRFIIESRPLEGATHYRNIPNINNPYRPTAVITEFGNRLIFKQRNFAVRGNLAFLNLDPNDVDEIVNTIRKATIETERGSLRILDGIRTDQIKSWAGEVTSSARTYYVDLSPASLVDEHTARRDLLLNIQDISGQITEQKLREELKAKDEIIAQQKLRDREQDHLRSLIAHDLKTPLTVIKGNAEMIIREIGKGIVEPERILNQAKSVYRGSIRELEMLDNALDELTNKKEAQLNEINSSLLFNIAVNTTEKLETDDFYIAYNCPSKPVNLLIDLRKILYALQNYINNAKQVGASSVTVIGTIEEDRKFLVTVTDDGPGMNTNMLKQCEIDGVSDKGGSGLGLGQAKKNIEDCGGEVLPIISEVGKGSTFSFTLPIC